MSTRHHLLARFLILLLLVIQGCASSSTQESTGEYIDDSVITTRVKTELLSDPTLKSLEISVETYKGVVQLSGFVSSQANIQRAVELARGVPGVRAVRSDMRLK